MKNIFNTIFPYCIVPMLNVKDVIKMINILILQADFKIINRRREWLGDPLWRSCDVTFIQVATNICIYALK